MQSVYLLQSSAQSEMDLKCLHYAKEIVIHNAQIRMCNGNEEDLITHQVQEIHSYQVSFEDKGTFIYCTYQNKEMKIYYDSNRLRGMDVDSH